nr:hypothetical protein Iba_chr02fCG0580 [Ipomoea batatas]
MMGAGAAKTGWFLIRLGNEEEEEEDDGVLRVAKTAKREEDGGLREGWAAGERELRLQPLIKAVVDIAPREIRNERDGWAGPMGYGAPYLLSAVVDNESERWAKESFYPCR